MVMDGERGSERGGVAGRRVAGEGLRAYRMRVSLFLSWAVQRFKRLPTVFQVSLVGLFWIGVSSIYGWHFISEHIPFSNQDEYTYVDYVEKASRGILLRRNMLIDQYTANELSCRGMEFVGHVVGECGVDVPIDELPIGGYSSGTIHSPLYFWITAGVSKVVMWITGAGLIPAARFTGAIWLGGGVATTYYLLRELGGTRAASVSAAILLLVSPQAWWSNFYVTPDAFNILAGASIVLAAIKFDRGKSGPWWFIFLSVFMSLIKFQEVFISIACLVYFVLKVIVLERGRSSRSRHLVAYAGAGVFLGVAAQFSWQWFRMRLSLPDVPGWDYPLDAPAPFNLQQALEQIPAFMTNLYAGPVSIMRSQLYIHAHVKLASMLVVAALIAAAIFPARISRADRVFVLSMLISLLSLGPLFYSYIALSSDTAFHLPPRYGGALLPVLFVGFPFIVRGRRLEAGVLLFSILTAVVAYYGNSYS